MIRNSPVISDEIDPERNIINSMADDLKFSGRFNELESELMKFSESKLNTAEIEAWHHLYGLAAFIRNDHIEACRRFENGLDKIPKSQDLMFSLGQEYIFLNEKSKAFSLFDQCSFPFVSRDVVLTMSRFAYLYNQFRRGMKYLTKILEIYLELKTVKDDYLFTNGYPLFGTTIKHFTAHGILSGNKEYVSEWIERIKSNCRDYSIFFDFLDRELRAYISDDYSLIINELRTKAEQRKENNDLCGYACLKSAVFSAFLEAGYEKAIDLIDEVETGEDEYPWLEDIKLIAQAKVAYKFSSEDEAFFIEVFFEYQPTLLSPDLALEFGVLDYQEKLKKKAGFIRI